jgi:hypothetical protein
MLKREIYNELFYTTGNAPQQGAHRADGYCRLILPKKYRDE